MTDTLFSLNGKIVPEHEAVVPVTDRGFLYGDGLFETIHAYGRHLFMLDDHLRRLKRGLETMAIAGAPPSRTLEKWLRAAVAAANVPEANVRLTVTRGSGPRGPSVRGTFKPFVVATVTEHHRRPASDYTSGVKAVLASFRRQESSVVATLKTTAYIEQIFARREADAAGADEALLLNNAGLLCEGSASNITLVRAGGLVVPDPQLVGALPGTMQVLALRLAREAGIPVTEAALGPWDLKLCDEAFLTGSLREITPLVRVGHEPIGPGRPGPLTKRLIRAFRAHVLRTCPGYRFRR